MTYMDFFRPHSWQYKPGRTVLVIGSSSGGPSRVPIEITSPASVSGIFGDGPLAQSLLLGITHMPDLHWVGIRLNGTPGRVELPPLEEEGKSPLILETVSGTANYNDYPVVLSDDGLGGLLLTIPASPAPLVYRLSDFATLGELVSYINRDAATGVCPFWASTGTPDLEPHELQALVGTYLVSGGNSGTQLTAEDMFLYLNEVLESIDGRPVDAIVLSGLYMDDDIGLEDPQRDLIPVSFHGRLAQWCYDQARRGRVVAGFVPCRPPSDASTLVKNPAAYADHLIWRLNRNDRLALLSPDGQDMGRFIHLICGALEWEGSEVTGEVLYAGQYLHIFSEPSLTNAPIPLPLVWELDSDTRNRLADAGIVTFYQDPRGQTRVWVGVTAAPKESDYHYSGNLRQVQIVISGCLERLEDFVGENFQSLYMTRRVDRAIETLLAAYRTAEVISEYTFSTEYRTAEKEIHLYLSVRPRYGVEEMQVHGQVTAG